MLRGLREKSDWEDPDPLITTSGFIFCFSIIHNMIDRKQCLGAMTIRRSYLPQPHTPALVPPHLHLFHLFSSLKHQHSLQPDSFITCGKYPLKWWRQVIDVNWNETYNWWGISKVVQNLILAVISNRVRHLYRLGWKEFKEYTMSVFNKKNHYFASSHSKL